MATRNDITGDLIKTKANSDTDAYADGWERIFGKKNKVADAEAPASQPVVSALCDICGKELNKVGECAWTSCPLNWDEKRTDIVGQNGNIGYGEDAS
jgi:hypothetical protein